MAETIKYYSIVTDIGAAAIQNAWVNGEQVDIIKFAVGDGNGGYYQPTTDMIKLKNEVWSGNIYNVEIDEGSKSLVNVTGIVPSNVGNFVIREVGLFDSKGRLIAVSNYPDIVKPILEDGISTEISIITQIAIVNSDVIKFTVDPTVIIMTKADLDKHNKSLEAHKALQDIYDPRRIRKDV